MFQVKLIENLYLTVLIPPSSPAPSPTFLLPAPILPTLNCPAPFRLTPALWEGGLLLSEQSNQACGALYLLPCSRRAVEEVGEESRAVPPAGWFLALW